MIEIIVFLLWWVTGVLGAGFAYASMCFHYGDDPIFDLIICLIYSLIGPIALVHALYVHGIHCGWKLWP